MSVSQRKTVEVYWVPGQRLWEMTGVWAVLVSAGSVIGCGRRRQHEWPASGLQGSGRERWEKNINSKPRKKRRKRQNQNSVR